MEASCSSVHPPLGSNLELDFSELFAPAKLGCAQEVRTSDQRQKSLPEEVFVSRDSFLRRQWAHRNPLDLRHLVVPKAGLLVVPLPVVFLRVVLSTGNRLLVVSEVVCLLQADLEDFLVGFPKDRRRLDLHRPLRDTDTLGLGDGTDSDLGRTDPGLDQNFENFVGFPGRCCLGEVYPSDNRQVPETFCSLRLSLGSRDNGLTVCSDLGFDTTDDRSRTSDLCSLCPTDSPHGRQRVDSLIWVVTRLDRAGTPTRLCTGYFSSPSTADRCPECFFRGAHGRSRDSVFGRPEAPLEVFLRGDHDCLFDRTDPGLDRHTSLLGLWGRYPTDHFGHSGPGRYPTVRFGSSGLDCSRLLDTDRLS